jgi:hypothetical protein
VGLSWENVKLGRDNFYMIPEADDRLEFLFLLK